MKDVAAIILAAGRGTRMKSDIPKVMHTLYSKPMLSFIIEALDAFEVGKKVFVLGYKANEVKKTFPGITAVLQEKLLGSGDAVKCAKKSLAGFKGDVLVMYGDTPLIKTETIKNLVRKHRKDRASCTLLTAELKNPAGYGRILRNGNEKVMKIVEDRDADIYEKVIEEINVGCYCFAKDDLFSYLEKVKVNAKKGEDYLTDVIELMARDNKKISSVLSEDAEEALGINSMNDLARAGEHMRRRTLERLMADGVTIVSPSNTFVYLDVKIGKDTVIYPDSIIEGGVTIGENCRIGPFARIRKGCDIRDDVEIGNFAELVRTKVSSGAKIKHMSYLGDADVGKNVNIGAGTITANYDGKNKNRTVIEDGAFIGVGSILIAPVKIGSNAVVGAGCVVTRGKDVPPGKTVIGVPARTLSKRWLNR